MIIFFDTETSGLYPGQICQLSYVSEGAEGINAKNFYFSVDSVEYGAYRVHGLSKEKLEILSEGRRFCDRAEEIYADFTAADIVVAHNAPFDISFLGAEFKRAGYDFKPKETFCSMRKTAKFCKIPRSCSQGYKYPKLSELCSHYGVSDVDVYFETQDLFGHADGFHDARFDTVAMYLAVKKAMKEGDVVKLKEFL